AGLPVTDRDQPTRLPQIALHQLPRPIDRALERARYEEPRTDLPDVVIEDRLAARIAKLGRHLPQPQRLDRRIGPQLIANPLLERIEPRRNRRAPIPRRHLAGQRAADRSAMQTRPATDLPNRQPLDPMHPP